MTASPAARFILCLALAGCGGALEGVEPSLTADTWPVVVGDADAGASGDAGTDAGVDPVVDAGQREPGAGSSPAALATAAFALANRSCGPYCHEGGEVLRHAINRPSVKVGRLKLVVPFDPEQSYLLMKVNGTHVAMPECLGTPSPCGVKMPSAGPQLSPAERELLRAWIAAGAPLP